MFTFGEISLIISAILWALAVVIFRLIGSHISPNTLNGFKNTLGLICISSTLLFLNKPLSIYSNPFHFSNLDLFKILLSGTIGMGIADIVYLKSLNKIGAGATAIISLLFSPSVFLLSYIFLNESLTTLQFSGGLLIIMAVFITAKSNESININKDDYILGIVMGTVAIFMMAIALVIIKPVLDKVEADMIAQIWVVGYRLIPAAIVPIIFSIKSSYRLGKGIFSEFKNFPCWPQLIIGSLLATYFSITIWILGIATTKASIAAFINQSSSVFMFVFAYFILNEKLTYKKLISILAAALGIIMITYH